MPAPRSRRQATSAARTAPDGELLLNRDELARLRRVKAGQITRMARDGMPVALGGGNGRQAFYRASDCVQWWLAQVEAKYAGLQGLNPMLERAKRDRAQAALAEQLHRRRAGEVLERDEVERVWSSIVVACRARLLRLPSALAARCAATESAADVERLLRDEVHTALHDLAAWKESGAAPPQLTLAKEASR